MRKILYCSTQISFREGFPDSLLEHFEKHWGAEDFIFITITVDEEFKSDVDWEKMKKKGVVAVVLYDDPHENVLGSFFREVAFTVKLPMYWYSRFGGRESLIEIKLIGE